MSIQRDESNAVSQGAPRRKAAVLVWLVSAYLLLDAVVGIISLTPLWKIPLAEVQRRIVFSPLAIWSDVVLCGLLIAGAILLLTGHRRALPVVVAACLLDLVSGLAVVIALGRVARLTFEAGMTTAVAAAIDLAIILCVWILFRRRPLARGDIASEQSRTGNLELAPQQSRGKLLPTIVAIAPVILGSGLVWQLMDCHSRQQAASLDALRTTNELYSHQQQLNAEISPLLPEYIMRRDDQVREAAHGEPAFPESTMLQSFRRRMEFAALRDRLTTLAIQYNHLEDQIATLEERAPRWLPLAIPPPPVTDLRSRPDPDSAGMMIYTFTVPNEDTVEAAVWKDLMTLRARHSRP